MPEHIFHFGTRLVTKQNIIWFANYGFFFPHRAFTSQKLATFETILGLFHSYGLTQNLYQHYNWNDFQYTALKCIESVKIIFV